MRYRLTGIVTAVLLALVAPPPVAAQTSPCDGQALATLFTVPATGASFVFPYATVNHDAGVAQYTLTFKAQAGGPVLSTQVVTKAATTVVGPTTTAGVTCYSIPIVPVAQIPAGVPMVAALTAHSATPALSSPEGAPSAPFGVALPAPPVRVRRPE